MQAAARANMESEKRGQVPVAAMFEKFDQKDKEKETNTSTPGELVTKQTLEESTASSSYSCKDVVDWLAPIQRLLVKLSKALFRILLSPHVMP